MVGPMDVVKCIWLPRRDEMRIILQKYIADISLFYHIVHVPSLQSLVEDIYAGLEANIRVDVGGVLLLIAICASTTYAWSPPDDIRCLFSDCTEANAQSTFWIKEALDVIDHAQRTAHASMECIQGLIILFFVFCNHESVSFRARSVFMTAIAMATELSLHRLDDPQGSSMPALVRMSEAKKEIARRVWWFMVATDWTLAQFCCPQEGFYLIQKNQMAVNKPRNANDEDIIEGVEIRDRPATEATCISYFVQRIRLAEVCRGLLDRTPLGTTNSEAVVYKDVLDADAKINQFLQEVPDFFSLDCSSLDDLPVTDPRRSPFITAQRYMLSLLLHRQLCKIHLPYLAQGTVDPEYAYSRDVCLRSARVIFELDHQLQRENLPFFNSRLRLAMVLRSVFLASIALVLNACLKGDSDESNEGGDEVAGAWKILHEAQGQFPPAAKLLELSIQILRKYKIKHRALDILQQQVSGLSPYGDSFPMTPESANQDLRMTTIQHSLGTETESTLMEQHWQVLEGKMDLNTIDWDKLFWGIDAPFM
ncbi:fungal transcriptional regulatory [Trichoderma arundinaceum]|uniref:Fungal transcriptional regulatory n=1 Tax=Trichoderma arundinaceum TaxID=490622 RepID=A0A395NXS6_TRIAR|nr:fungal transcriptional regulatory [Trichoderma arundinaceum]